MCQSCKPAEAPLPLENPPIMGEGGQWGLFVDPRLPQIELRDLDGKLIVLLCSSCDAKLSPDELVTHCNDEHDKLCEECRTHCEECGNVYRNDDDEIKSAYDGDSYRSQWHEQIRCDSCCWQCADCDEYFYGDGSENANDKKICCHCAENYTTCESCSCRVHNDNSVYIEEDSQSYCESCGNERQAQIDDENREDEDTDDEDTDDEPQVRRAANVPSELVHNYTYKPRAVFYRADGETLATEFYGLELETETENKPHNHDEAITQSGIAADSCFYCKADGSLDEGFEIVSHPGSYRYWMARDWSFCGKLESAGYESYRENCGLHIHVSRSALTTPQIAKLLLFSKRNQELLRHLSRRISATALNDYARLETDSTGTIIYKSGTHGRDTGNHQHRYRYTAINLENEKTIEFRLFQGTLNPQEIRRNIALVAALMAFIRVTPLTRLDAQDFRDYLARHGRASIGREMTTALIRWIDSLRCDSVAA